MPDLESFRFYIPHSHGPKKGKLHLSSWHMTVEEARKQYGPDVQPEPLSKEVHRGAFTLPPGKGGERPADESLRLLREWKPKE